MVPNMLPDSTAVVSTPLLIDELTDTLERAAEDAIAFIPDLVVGLLILAIGYAVGTLLHPVVARLVQRMQVDLRLQDTTMGELLGIGEEPQGGQPPQGQRQGQPPQGQRQGQPPQGQGQGQPPQGQGQGQPPQGRGQPPQGQDGQASGRGYGPIANAVGIFVKYYVVLFALLLAAERWGIDQLSVGVTRLLEYAPEFLAGVAIIIVGLVFADYAARRTRNSELAAESEYGTWITALVRGVLYFVVLVIGLEMLGLDIRIVYMLVDGIASGVGVGITVAIALAIGIAAGLYLKDYYEEEIQSDS